MPKKTTTKKAAPKAAAKKEEKQDISAIADTLKDIQTKFGEEAIEIIIEAAKKNKAGLIREAADLLYHCVVMLHSNGVKLSDIRDELESRKSKSGIEEKKSRIAQ